MSELKLDRLARIEAKVDALTSKVDALLNALAEPESEAIVDLDGTTEANERDPGDEL